MSPRPIFEQELKILRDHVAQMCERAEISYNRMLIAIKSNDRDMLRKLLDNDREMTDMQRGIEAKCLTMITKQQPVARDLRLVTAALKVVNDIERIGDHVGDIAELCLRMEEDYNLYENVDILEEMSVAAKNMLVDAGVAFINADAEAAEGVIMEDDDVDDLFNRVKNSMMDAIRNSSLDADKVVDILMIAKYLEKIGDHAVTIAEWAEFLATGDMQGVKLY